MGRGVAAPPQGLSPVDRCDGHRIGRRFRSCEQPRWPYEGDSGHVRRAVENDLADVAAGADR